MRTAIIEVNNPELGKFRELLRNQVYIVLKTQPPALPYSPERAKRGNHAIHVQLEKTLGETDLVLDLPQNIYEQRDDGSVVIRKGSVCLLSGERSVPPSHMRKSRVRSSSNRMIHRATRYQSLYNAGRAAEVAGEPAEALGFYQQLLKVTNDVAHTQRPEITYARSFVRHSDGHALGF